MDELPCTVSHRCHFLSTQMLSRSPHILIQMILLLTKSMITDETRSHTLLMHFSWLSLCIYFSKSSKKNEVSSFRASPNPVVIFDCNVCLLAAQVYLQPRMLRDALIVLTRLGTGCLLWSSGFRDVKYCSERMNLLRYLLAARRERHAFQKRPQ